jgi:protein disulfide-isomerase A6
MRNFQSVVLSCFLTLAVLGRDCLAHLYDNDAHVKVIDKYSTFENEILKSESVWMIQFFSPTSPNSKQAKPKYSQIASIMRSIAYVAVVDMSTEAGERIGATLKVDSYPTYYMYGDDKNNPVEYTGERDLQGILQGLMNCVALTVQSRARDSSATKSKIREELPEKRKELPELTNTTILEEECGGKNRICVLAALPHILDSGADGRNKYKALVFNVSKSFPFSTYRFMWFEGGSQPDLEDALE